MRGPAVVELDVAVICVLGAAAVGKRYRANAATLVAAEQFNAIRAVGLVEESDVDVRILGMMILDDYDRPLPGMRHRNAPMHPTGGIPGASA